VPLDREVSVLRDQVALVTGGTRGLGLAIATALAADGAAVACVARSAAEVESGVDALRGGGARALGLTADVTNEAQVGTAVQATVREFGRLDIVVLNAGGWFGAPIADTSEADWDRIVGLNLKGAFLTLKHAIPHLVARRGSTVVGIGSIGGLVGSPGEAVYAAAKWGLRGLLESAAHELRPHGVRVSLVHPHSMNATGAGRALGSPERDRNLDYEDVARTVAFVCAAPGHVALGNVTVWPVAAGIGRTTT
jgi:NAD(P)-dependent dehydrogenase (short-subunit alcohol dehydrogenase family)